jgi:hypothetical protein
VLASSLAVLHRVVEEFPRRGGAAGGPASHDQATPQRKPRVCRGQHHLVILDRIATRITPRIGGTDHAFGSAERTLSFSRARRREATARDPRASDHADGAAASSRGSRAPKGAATACRTPLSALEAPPPSLSATTPLCPSMAAGMLGALGECRKARSLARRASWAIPSHDGETGPDDPSKGRNGRERSTSAREGRLSPIRQHADPPAASPQTALRETAVTKRDRHQIGVPRAPTGAL